MNKSKNSLNIFKTNFSMKANLLEKEKKILNYLNKINIYKYIIKKTNNKPIFILHDGPPYANGKLHIGNILNKILKDIILKFKRLDGYYCPFTPGWDCHGLPIELKMLKNVNRKINIDEKKEFILNCKKYVIEQIENQKKDFIKLGVIADWNNYYYTMNNNYIYNNLECLRKMYKHNYIKYNKKPVYWCIKCMSTLSEFEIKYKNIKSNSIYFLFKIKNNNIIKNIIKNKSFYKKTYFLIWTTTPWTIPDNEAISINPNITYNVVNIEKINIILSESSTYRVLTRKNIKNFIIICSIKGYLLKNLYVINSISNKIIKIIFDSNIKEDVGTSVVHIAPGHGIIDYELSLENNINISNSINEYGNYINNFYISELSNKNIFIIYNQIINILNKHKILFYLEDVYHDYPYCERHNEKIIFRLIYQWFIDLENKNLRKNCINEIEKNVNFIPKWGKNNLINMLLKRKDWCISRQRTWGCPIPIFIDNNNIPYIKTNKIFKKINKIIKKEGIIGWININPEIFGLNSNYFKKTNDIIDIWFDSGTSFINYIKNIKYYKKKEKISKSDIYIEGIDQFRGWFMSSLIIFVAINNYSPYKNILTHHFVLNKNNIKISKSLDNYKIDIINTFDSDIIRLWVANNNFKKDILINKESFDRVIDLYRKIRNVIKFLISNIDLKYNYNNKNNYLKLLIIDIWFLNLIYKTQIKIIEYYNKYQFHLVIDEIKILLYKEISYYIDIIKDKLYTFNKNSICRLSCQIVLYNLLKFIVKWIFPILSFTAFEINEYTKIYKNKKNIFIEEWEIIPAYKNNLLKYKNFIDFIFNIKYKINKIIEICINKKIINSSLECFLFIYLKNCNNDIYFLCLLYNELKYFFMISGFLVLNYKIDKINYDYIYEINNNFYIYLINNNRFFYKKCDRCWNFYQKVNYKIFKKNTNYCLKCIKNIFFNEETRIFV